MLSAQRTQAPSLVEADIVLFREFSWHGCCIDTDAAYASIIHSPGDNMKAQRSSILIMILAGLLAFTPIAQAKKDKRSKGERVTPTATVQAKVVRYLVNPFGEVDGLILDNGTLAKTPPHLSAELVSVAKPGDAVTLQGRPEAGTSLKVYSVTNAASNQTMTQRPEARNEKRMPKHLRSTGLKEMNASGAIQHIISGKRGEPKGVVLDNGTGVRLPKQTGYAFYALIKVGAPLAARGYGTENAYGRALEATALGTSLGSLQPLFGQPGAR
jgi:hypothetical protein